MQVKYYNSGNNQWENTNPLPPEEIYIGDTPPAQGINAKLWLDTSVTGLLPASYAVADNCEQTVAGQAVLDAHQGYLLQNQINNLSSYSTTEQVIGTWIDGKPLYRKIVQFTPPSSWSKAYDTAGLNIDIMVSMRGMTLGGQPLPYYLYDSSWNYYIKMGFAKGSGGIFCEAKGYTADCILILEYTKTTD